MIRQDHGIDLDAVHLISVITNDPGELDLPDFGQLLKGETAWPASILIPESISKPEVMELAGHDASKGWANHGSGQGLLRDTSRPEVNVFNRGIVLSVAIDSLVVEGSMKFIPVLEGPHATEFSPLVVSRHTVFTSTLQVE